MILGLRNNLAIEDMMLSLGKRSANKDIENFAIIFNVSYRAGGNIKEIVRRTADIIGEKMESVRKSRPRFLPIKFSLPP